MYITDVLGPSIGSRIRILLVDANKLTKSTAGYKVFVNTAVRGGQL